MSIETQGNALTFASIDGDAGLRAALALSRADIIDTVTDSGMKGRGGAGFQTGMKWNFAGSEKGAEKYVICNADEGEPGTFKDRVILTEFADLVFAGMAIAGRAIGAREGIVYLRGEYTYLRSHLNEVIKKRRAAGLLGKDVGGVKGFDFDIIVALGAGAYICGEETALIEGMTIAGVAVGATQGYIYLRSEYPHAFKTLKEAIQRAREAGYLGTDVLGSGKTFELEVRLGAGAYICGEETSLLESLEGKRGIVRFKPPLPAIEGLFGKPTVINNVISLCSVPIILAKGGTHYQDFGMGRSRGTLPFQLTGNIKHGGLVEKAFGLTLNQLLYDFGGGSASGRPIRAVQVGGPLGAYVPESQFDLPLDYEAYSKVNAMIGHGGVVVFDDTVDMAEQARYAMEFCAIESCGKCTPCRIGSTRGTEVMDAIIAGRDVETNIALMRSLCDTMLNGSLCALGGMAPYPVLSALNHFPEDFAIQREAAAA